ncbi:hypothetical protein RGQ13_12185 [Thalassotalea psychrophila]|uniref:Uncharacterized protein n=1 Tax=Thalassotalea psychrophila TaxID=3065647 RepID=A0ABY9TQ79_9GAMM|nr:hypothetical protein RGQ13_12185 [Colwelliaceae bacterium SQ149]
MTLFSWFSHNNKEPETTLRLSERKNKNRLTLKAKSMWPVAKVRQMPESLINSNKSVESNLDSDDFIKEAD